MVSVDDPLDKRVAKLMCMDTPDRLGPNVYKQLHFRFRERRGFPHVLASSLVIECVDVFECERFAETAAQMQYYAHKAEPRHIRAQLAQMGFDSSFVEAYLTRFAACRRVVDERAADLGERAYHFYGELPNQVRQRRRKHWATYAEHWKAYDLLDRQVDSALRARQGAAPLIERAEELRRTYVRDCNTNSDWTLERCAGGPLARPLTRAIIKLAMTAGDGPRVLAEQRLLENVPPTDRIARAIHLAQSNAIRAEKRRYKEYTEAKKSGVDEETLRVKFGDPPPIEPGLSRVWHVREKKPDYLSLVENAGELTEVHGVISRVRRRGSQAVITFKRRVHRWAERDCVDTNKVDRIDPRTGEVIYQQRCRHVRTRTETHTTEPVKIPTSEIVGVDRGSKVVVAVDENTREGYLVRGYRDEQGDELAQLRDLAAE